LCLPGKVFDQHRSYAINVGLIRQNARDEEDGRRRCVMCIEEERERERERTRREFDEEKR